MYCCKHCFEDNEIINFIIKHGQIGKCDYCNQDDTMIIETEKLGSFIRDGFFRAYDHVEDFTGAMWDSDDKCYRDAQGDEGGFSLIYILGSKERIFSLHNTIESSRELLQDLMNDSGLSFKDRMDGCVDHLSDIESCQFVKRNSLYGMEIISENIAWESFKETCKYFNRYFDLSPESSREALLCSLKTLFKYMETIVDSGTDLYRVRNFSFSNDTNITEVHHYQELAPAPKNYSTNNRMSPAGISYMYLATDLKTCIKETHLNEKDSFIAGKFSTRRPLKILDLSFIPKIPTVSIFSNEYNHDWTWIQEFVRDFSNEISKPISSEEKDIEYIPTQILSEYIRKLGYEGIKFESSVNRNSYNIVLFCGPNPNFSKDNCGFPINKYSLDELEYFDNWLTLTEFKYGHITTEYEIKSEFLSIAHPLTKPLFPSSIRYFYHILEIEDEIEEMKGLATENSNVYLKNEIQNNFSFKDTILNFVNCAPNEIQKFCLSTENRMNSKIITVSFNQHSQRDSMEIRITEKDANEKWNKLLNPKI